MIQLSSRVDALIGHIRMCGGLYEYLNNRINFV